jgi:hypothetical protein
MELISKDDGLGTFRLTETEFNLLQRIKKVTSSNLYLANNNYDQTPELIAAVHELFPELPLQPEAEQCTFPFSYQQNYPYDPITEFRFRAGAPPGIFNVEYKQALELNIKIPLTVKMDNQYSMTVRLIQYTPNCVDDMVKKLGKREKEPIIGVARLGYNSYGIAEVHDLNRVFATYQRAVELFEKSLETIGISKSELWVLRRDGQYHENLVIRELSRERYQEELLRLINH